MQLFQNFPQQNAPSNHVDAATKNVAKHEPLYAIAKMKTSDDDTKDPTENLGKFLQDSVENPIKVLKSNPSNKTSIQKDTIFVAEARTDVKKAKECSEENVIKKPTDEVRAIDENASNRVKELKTTKPDESKAALKKPDACEDKEVNDVEAILLSPFDPGIKKEPSDHEENVKNSSEISIFETQIQEFQPGGPSVVVCLRILFPDQRTALKQLIFKLAQPAQLQFHEMLSNEPAAEFMPSFYL